MSTLIKNNLVTIKNEIKEIALKFKRQPEEITLIAVSKFQSKEKILEAQTSGQIDFGENYIKEWQEKCKYFHDNNININWHVIGNIQKNKAKYLTNQVHYLQSLDSIELAKEIEKKAKLETKLKVLIQLQIDRNDMNKSGISYENSQKLRDYVVKSSKLALHGFMGIGPFEIELSKRKDLYFNFVHHAQNLWQDIPNTSSISPIISLGMSSDFATAIECGSNMVRIGTTIFGERTKDSF